MGAVGCSGLGGISRWTDVAERRDPRDATEALHDTTLSSASSVARRRRATSCAARATSSRARSNSSVRSASARPEEELALEADAEWDAVSVPLALWIIGSSVLDVAIVILPDARAGAAGAAADCDPPVRGDLCGVTSLCRCPHQGCFQSSYFPSQDQTSPPLRQRWSVAAGSYYG